MLKLCVFIALLGVSSEKVIPARMGRNARPSNSKQNPAPAISNFQVGNDVKPKTEANNGAYDVININLSAENNKVPEVPIKKIIFYETGSRSKAHDVIERRAIIKEKLKSENKQRSSPQAVFVDRTYKNTSADEDKDFAKKTIIFHKIGVNNEIFRADREKKEIQVEHPQPVSTKRKQSSPSRALPPSTGNNDLLPLMEPMVKQAQSSKKKNLLYNRCNANLKRKIEQHLNSKTQQKVKKAVLADKYKTRKRRSVFAKKRGANGRRSGWVLASEEDVSADTVERNIPRDIQGGDRRQLVKELSRLNRMYNRARSGSKAKPDRVVINEPHLSHAVEEYVCPPCDLDNGPTARPCFIERQRFSIKDITISNTTQHTDNKTTAKKALIPSDLIESGIENNRKKKYITTTLKYDPATTKDNFQVAILTTTQQSNEGENIKMTTPQNNPNKVEDPTTDNAFVSTTQQNNNNDDVTTKIPETSTKAEHLTKEPVISSTPQQNDEDNDINVTTPNYVTNTENLTKEPVSLSTTQQNNEVDNSKTTTPESNSNNVDDTITEIPSTTKHSNKRRTIRFEIGKSNQRRNNMQHSLKERVVSRAIHHSDKIDDISISIGDTGNIEEFVKKIQNKIKRRNLYKKW